MTETDKDETIKELRDLLSLAGKLASALVLLQASQVGGIGPRLDYVFECLDNYNQAVYARVDRV